MDICVNCSYNSNGKTIVIFLYTTHPHEVKSEVSKVASPLPFVDTANSIGLQLFNSLHVFFCSFSKETYEKREQASVKYANVLLLQQMVYL